MKIAIPVENRRLHGHFGGCREFALVEVDADRKEILYTEFIPAPEHRPGVFPNWLREHGATVIITGGIGEHAMTSFAHYGLLVRAGIPDAPVEQLVTAYLNGQLTATPLRCNHHSHHHQPAHHRDQGSREHPIA